MKTDRHTRFLESRWLNKGKACDFLDGLHVKREELAAVGMDIDENDYLSMIIGSLPFHLANFAAYCGADCHHHSQT